MAEAAGGGVGIPQQLSPEQIARYAYQAGFRGRDLAIAVAIAMAESGGPGATHGNRMAKNDKGQDYSIGLWQINMLAHKQRFGTEQMLYDPMVNAKAAFALYKGRGDDFTDWSVYIKANDPNYPNPYTKHMETATRAANSISHTPISPSSGTIPNPVQTSAPLPFGDGAGGGGQFVAAAGGGVNFAGGADTDASGDIDDDELAAHIQRTYPQMLWALDHPELGPLLRQAAEESWDTARIYGALVQTSFWRDHPDRERVLINLRQNDPATYQRMLDERAADVREVAEQIGWGVLPDQRLRTLTEEAMANGWSAQQIQDRIVEAVPISLDQIAEGNVGGRIAEIKMNLDQITNDHLMSISDKEKTDWIRRILKGEVDEQAFAERMRTMAIGQFPWMADAIERGISPKAFTDPYKNWIAQTLEMSPEQIDMAHRRYQNVIYDDTAAQIRTLPEVEEFIRSSFPEWHQTRTANEEYANLTEGLAKTFGRIA